MSDITTYQIALTFKIEREQNWLKGAEWDRLLGLGRVEPVGDEKTMLYMFIAEVATNRGANGARSATTIMLQGACPDAVVLATEGEKLAV